MKRHIKGPAHFLNESGSIKELPARDERPMVEGIAKILRGVRDLKNRQELANSQVREFKREGIRFDYREFFKLCDLPAGRESLRKDK
jgi:hypothetical protein